MWRGGGRVAGRLVLVAAGVRAGEREELVERNAADAQLRRAGRFRVFPSALKAGVDRFFGRREARGAKRMAIAKSFGTFEWQHEHAPPAALT